MDGWALAVVALVLMALSVFAHGISAWPGADRYADWYAAHAEDHLAMPESTPSPNHASVSRPAPTATDRARRRAAVACCRVVLNWRIWHEGSFVVL
jgi:hypothetical protein